LALGAAGYSLRTRGTGCTTGPFSTDVDHPSRPAAFAASAPAGIAVGSATFHFDRIGRPRDPGGALRVTPISVSVGSLTLVVEPETGYVREP
jgi:hypothetical protein